MGIRLRSLGLAIAALFVLAAALLYSTRSSAAPSIAWTPASLTQSVDAGQSKTTVVSFKASETLSNVTVWVVPELRPYVQTTPTTFASLVKGQIVTLTIATSAPVTAPTGTLDGTIHIRSGSKTIAKPLPITLAVTVPQQKISIAAVGDHSSFMSTTIAIEARDVAGIQEIRIRTEGLPRNLRRSITLDWGEDQPPGDTWRGQFSLPSLFRPQLLGGEAALAALTGLRIAVDVVSVQGQETTATVTVPFK